MTYTHGYNAVNMSINSFDDFLRLVNDSGAGYTFTMINFLVFAVLFITLSTAFGWESAMLSAGFVGIILSLLFVYMGVMNIWIAGFFVGLITVGIIYVIWSNKYD